MLSLLLAIVPAATATPAAPAVQDWPHWNGPERDGRSREERWDDRGQVAWTVDVGLGYSSVAVVGGALYTLGHDAEASQDRLFCLDAATGEERWRHTFAAETMDNFHTGGSLTTPTVVGGRVFVQTREGLGLCLDAVSGEVIWRKDYRAQLELKLPMYGFSASPLAHEGELFLLYGGTLLRVDPVSGAILRRNEDWGDGGYSNPLPYELRGRGCLVVFAAPGLLVLDRATFEELHRFPWKGQGGSVHAGTPILLPDERIYFSSAYGAGAALLQIGEEAEPELLWRSRGMRNKVDGSLLIDGHFYGFDESMLKCLDMQGEERWRVRGLGMGAVGAAGDRLLVLTSKGELIVAAASPEGFEELSRAQVIEQDQGVCWTYPVLADGRVYCRGSEGALVCVDHRATSAAVAGADEAVPEADWPHPPALFERHLAASGGQAWAGRVGAHLEGALEITGAGITRCPMTLDWAAPDRWAQTYDLGEFGAVQRGYDGEIAWILDPFYGDRLLEGEALREWADTRNLASAASYAERHAAWRTAGPVDFADRACWAVDVVSRRGARRRLYFERESGLLRGREGRTEHLLVFDAYQEFDGVKLATQVTRIAPETGEEERWFITSVTWELPADEAFALPEKVVRMLRSPEEVEGENALVTEQYGAYFGLFGDPEDRHYETKADDGAFTMMFGGRGYALAPTEGTTDSFTLRDIPAVQVVFGRDAAGDVIEVTL